MTNKKDIYLILNKNQIKKLPHKAKYVFCFSEFINQYINNNSLTIINPNPKKSALLSKKLLNEVQQSSN